MRTSTLLGLLFTMMFVQRVAAQGTAFTYQGQLTSAGAVANGRYDFQFTVYDAATGGAQQGTIIAVNSVGVTNGLFTTPLDFGNIFAAGARRWLSISVRTNGTGNFNLLDPRQEITPTPYAITAGSVRPGAITGGMIAPDAITSDKIADGAVKLVDIDDVGASAYATAAQELTAVGVQSAVAFEKLRPVVSTNGGSVSITLTLNSGLSAPVIGFSAEEAISQLPVYVAQVRLPTAYDVDAQVGSVGLIQVARNGRTNSFNGFVTAITLSGRQVSSAERIYTVRLESALAALRYTRDYRVRLEMKASDAIANVLSSIPQTMELQGTYQPKDQFIQFGETSFNFVSRLMEEEGIFYFVEASAPGGKVIVADSTSSYRSIASALPYYGNNPTTVPAGAEYVTDFKKASRQTTVKTTLATYPFELPGALRQSSATGPRGVGEKFEYMNWNRSGIDPAGGDRAAELQKVFTELPVQAGIRQARNNLEAYIMTGESTSPELHPGYTFTLSDQTSAGLSGSYVVTRVRHAAFSRLVNGVTVFSYGNEFEAIPSALPFRPAWVTPKPVAQPCTATVVGPAGETTFVDKYGRVKVQFHWDRYGTKDQNSSAWVRVATPMAGSQSGMIFIPQIGDEVLVSFLLGDPNAPVILGSLYNPSRMPPYALPANKNSGGISIRSSDNNVNEVRFDGAAGVQQLSINAARDLVLDANHQINVAGPLAINGGNTFNRVQSGQAVAGSGTTASKTVTFNFPAAFTGTPKVIVTAQHEVGWDVGDTFVATVKSVSTTSCTVNILRVDQNGGWSMALRLNWIAWD